MGVKKGCQQIVFVMFFNNLWNFWNHLFLTSCMISIDFGGANPGILPVIKDSSMIFPALNPQLAWGFPASHVSLREPEG